MGVVFRSRPFHCLNWAGSRVCFPSQRGSSDIVTGLGTGWQTFMVHNVHFMLQQDLNPAKPDLLVLL